MKDRGMLKWAPYKSLDQQADFLARMDYERNKRPCPQMSSDKAEEINDLLANYKGEKIVARYWHDGYIYAIHGYLEEVSTIYGYLRIGGEEIYFRQLTDLYPDDD